MSDGFLYLFCIFADEIKNNPDEQRYKSLESGAC